MARLDAGFPASLKLAIEFLVTGRTDAEIEKIADQVEVVRARIAEGGDSHIDILYSPKPGSSGHEVVPEMRPAHGEKLAFTMERVAKTGKDRRWGTSLHLLAKGGKAVNILELGACAGISGCYLSSTPDCMQFTTVEGSESLASLAQQSLNKITSRSRVIHGLFDVALDQLLPQNPTYDLVFIDGHHEKIGTIHYFRRIAPYLSKNAMIIFDDISWSTDMRDGWNELAKENIFAHSVDLGLIGVCLCGPNEGGPRYWNMQDIVGAVSIGKPREWKD
jgi:predicted O-methyltransferase YrrM